jgi:SAM-dependent methyltransferase
MGAPRQLIGGALRRIRGPAAGDGAEPAPAMPPAPPAPEPPDYDWWLHNLFGESLAALDAACAGAGPEAFARFRDLDDDLWAVLLTQEYTLYPNIRALLPETPAPDLQMRWNGAAGLDLLRQSKDFYAKAKDRYARDGAADLARSRILDFGCGWGRLTRFFARDVEPGALAACDPVEEILDVCRRTRIPALLERSEFVPDRLPFSEPFDLVFSFSVFTHISEVAHARCLEAIHAAMNPGGILVVTIRPPAYLRHSPLVGPLLDSLGPDPLRALEEPRYLFIPHGPDPGHPQYESGEMTYGETVISLPYVRERWSPAFELLDVALLAGDMHQVMLTLRRG